MVLEEEDENKVKDEKGKLDDLEELSLKRKPKLLMKIKQELKRLQIEGRVEASSNDRLSINIEIYT